MKTLEQVAKAYKKSAAKAIYPGVPYPKYRKTKSSRAYDTGNLLTAIVRNNKPNEMVRKKEKGYDILLEIAPNDARYGYFVHNGTYKMQARPFADIAWNDTDQNLQVALDELAEQEGIDKLLEPMTENIDTFFQGAGFKSS